MKNEEEVKVAGERFNPEKANSLLSEKRYKLLDPDHVLTYFNVEQGNVMADLGAGNGFFTLPIAKKTDTTVYAVDIEPHMLELLKQRADKEDIRNITYIESGLYDIKLDDNLVDKAMISLVLHEVPDLSKALEEVKRILKHGGQVLIIEWEAKRSEMGPPFEDRIASTEMENILRNNGFKVDVKSFNEDIYVLKGIASK
nr:class I SAM-dependent methyltransferase [Salipaludibacillus agaradhaerens]